MDKKFCIHCGKQVKRKRSIYCSKKCYIEHNVQKYRCRMGKEEETVKEVFKRFKAISQCDFSRRDGESTSFKRIFYYALVEILKITTMSIERAMSFDHSTVVHHIRHTTEEEKLKAKSFVERNTLEITIEEKPISEFERNIKRLGFSYKTGLNHAIM